MNQRVKNKLTQEELKKQLYYDPETGVFVWKIGKQSVKAGSVAGCLMSRGYIRICFNKKPYFAHRLAFLYMEGYFPENQVDHINRVKGDNSWCNLREVSTQCNTRNSTIKKTNISGVTGVSWCKPMKKWMAQIKINNKAFYLGYFENKLDAAKARWNAEVKYGYPNCNTTSSAYLYIKKHIGVESA